jgi:hypothetical protein
MITIFCDFRQFSAKTGVFLKKQCHDQIWHNLALFRVKNAYFLAKVL